MPRGSGSAVLVEGLKGWRDGGGDEGGNDEARASSLQWGGRSVPAEAAAVTCSS